MSVDAWLESGKYLPAPLRDFHDQKDVFKAIHETVKEDPASFVKRPTWIEGHCYVIDTFLWYMARRGYTLQRSRQRLPFRDLNADVAAKNNERMFAEASIFDNMNQQKEAS